MKIGVFDSGKGGKSVAAAIEQSLPMHEVIFREDHENLPYGNKSIDELKKLVLPILKDIVSRDKCDVIVIACNTVTTNIIPYLRDNLSVPLVGLEPMVKTAAGLTKSKVIAVCATPATLRSERYTYLKSEFASGIQIIEPDCSDWASMIEKDDIEEERIRSIVYGVLNLHADVIVMGCTHYHWITDTVQSIAGDKARVLQPEEPVVAQLKRVLEQLS